MKDDNSLFNIYFEEYEVKDEFRKKFISLWAGWLGAENYYKLDEVSVSDWEKFNLLTRRIHDKYEMLSVNLDKKIISKISNIEETLSDYSESMEKSSNKFSIFIIPELQCVLSEDWDFTYILWYKNNETIEKLSPLILECDLFHFS